MGLAVPSQTVTSEKPNDPPVQLFGAASGLAPITNLLATGDPDVQRFGDQWWMFFGAAQVDAAGNMAGVNIFTASLPSGAALNRTDWSITCTEASSQDAQPLVQQPQRGQWDEWLHTPSYVHGPSTRSALGQHDGKRMRDRIYYAGSSASSGSAERQLSIGVMERVDGTWVRRADPVLRGTTSNPCVFEPKVRFLHGKWRMWYLAAPKEPESGELPDYRIEYVDSDDGIDWSEPHETFSSADSYFDAAVTQRPDGAGYDMVAARGPNRFATPGFPSPGLWWLGSRAPSGNRSSWTADPVQLLDAESGAVWYAAGAFGPCARYDTDNDPGLIHVFFTGAAQPAPHPYVLSIGRLDIRQPTLT